MGYTIAKGRDVKTPRRAAKGEMITFEEFYEIIPEGIKADLIDGKIIRDSPAVPRHGRVTGWVLRLLGNFVEALDLGEVLTAPTTVRLSQYQGPEPDVFFVSKPRLSMVGEKYVDGPPDLCVEVISKTSRRRDRGRKSVLYADHGVREYWIIDPLLNEVEFFENQSGAWRTILPDAQGRLCSKVLHGFWLKPEWLQGELPPVLPLMVEMLKESR
jgi:Uma2 family endonuclease